MNINLHEVNFCKLVGLVQKHKSDCHTQPLFFLCLLNNPNNWYEYNCVLHQGWFAPSRMYWPILQYCILPHRPKWISNEYGYTHWSAAVFGTDNTYGEWYTFYAANGETPVTSVTCTTQYLMAIHDVFLDYTVGMTDLMGQIPPTLPRRPP